MNDDKENEETIKLLKEVVQWLTFFGVVTILTIVAVGGAIAYTVLN